MAILPPAHSCRVFAADDIYVHQGVNLGDGLGPQDELCLGDIYQLAQGATSRRLTLIRNEAGDTVAQDSEIGEAGASVTLIARYMLMGSGGDPVELLVLEVGAQLMVLPRAPMAPRVDYTLLDASAPPDDVHLADLICVSFARGTMIALADGRQHPIEMLAIGDAVLTRDHGHQPIRWIGRATLRALGSFAPVVISAGALGNAGDLVVSQHHRMFLYQRKRLPGMTTSELLVQARHLTDGATIYLREGGYVDYFSLVFDRHEIIYAEGIPAESLMVNDATLNRLPVELALAVKAQFPGLSQVQHFGTEAGRQLLDQIIENTPWRRPGEDR